MTRKIKKILLYDNDIMKVFLKPSIISTRMGNSTIDIHYKYEYNILGMLTINIIQGIYELVLYGLKGFSIDNYFKRAEYKTLLNINKNYFTDKEIKYLENFPVYGGIYNE